MAAPSPPPPYEEVHSSRVNTPRRVDAATPILAVPGYTLVPGGQPSPRYSARQSQQSDREQVQQNPEASVFSLQKFVFVWLGIGKWYSGLCLLLYMIFFGWGIAIIIMTATVNNKDFTACQPLIPVKALSLFGGALFVVLGGFWVCAFAWKRRSCGGGQRVREQDRNFTILGCFIWVLSTLLISTAAALGVLVFEHHNLILLGFCSPNQESEYCPPGCNQNNNERNFFNIIPLVVAASIGCVFIGFLCFNILFWCCIRKEVGRVCC